MTTSGLSTDEMYPLSPFSPESQIRDSTVNRDIEWSLSISSFTRLVVHPTSRTPVQGHSTGREQIHYSFQDSTSLDRQDLCLKTKVFTGS